MISKRQIKGDLRHQRKNQQPTGIFSNITGMNRTLHQQEAENREGRTANVTQDTIDAPPEFHMSDHPGQR